MARDLFLHLCQVQVNNRYCATTALQHPWITRYRYAPSRSQVGAPVPLTIYEENMRRVNLCDYRAATTAMLFLSLSLLASSPNIGRVASPAQESPAEQVQADPFVPSAKLGHRTVGERRVFQFQHSPALKKRPLHGVAQELQGIVNGRYHGTPKLQSK